MLKADKVIRELQSNNRLLKSELQATATTFKRALHVAQTMLDTGMLFNHHTSIICYLTVCSLARFFACVLEPASRVICNPSFLCVLIE